MLTSLMDLALGSACAGCGAAGAALCPVCQARLSEAPRQVHRDVVGFPATLSCAPYDEVTRRIIVECKDRGRWSLAGVLAEHVARGCAATLLEHSVSSVTLVPVPSRPQAVRRRGADVLARVAQATSRRLRAVGVDCRSSRALRQSARAPDHVGLSREARWQASYGSMRWNGGAERGPIIVVDDVVTSGASLAEASRAARAEGVVVLGAVTLAARGWS